LFAYEDKSKWAISYIKLVEDFTLFTDFRETNPYRDYVSKFPVFEYMVPERDLFNDTWKLFLQLAMASPSTRLKVSLSKQGLPRVAISTNGIVDGKARRVTRSVHRLYSFQAYRIIEIYLDELFEKEVLMATDSLNWLILTEEREKRIEKAYQIIEWVEKQTKNTNNEHII
jgi:hypothetical protein